MKKKKLTPRRLLMMLIGLLFAVYSAYNVFIIFRDLDSISSEGIVISAIVALLFALIAVYACTAGVKNIRFRVIRIRGINIVLLAVFALKLRLIDKVIAYMEIPEMYAVLYGVSYFMTLTALLILFIYYVFILRRPLLFPRVSVILPVSAALLFLGSFILDMILLCVFHLSVEGSFLRTIVIRPIFYLGFIGLSVYYLVPSLSSRKKNGKKQEGDKENDSEKVNKNEKGKE